MTTNTAVKAPGLKRIKNDGTYTIETSEGKVAPDYVHAFKFHGIELFVHRPYFGKIMENNIAVGNQWQDGWMCTEKSTGLKVIIYAQAIISDAIKFAEKMILDTGVEEAKRIIQEASK